MVVVEVEGRLVLVVEGRLGPVAAVGAALSVGVFLLRVAEVEVVAGRLVVVTAEPPVVVAVLGRDLAAALGLVAPGAGCAVGMTHTGWMEGKIRRESKGD